MVAVGSGQWFTLIVTSSGSVVPDSSKVHCGCVWERGGQRDRGG